MTAPRVFLSYSHDNETHREDVLQLAFKLRESGIDACIDRFVAAPLQGWPRWMMNEIDSANFVLLVCTDTYRRRFEGREEPGKGQGATLEGLLATQYIYNLGTVNHKFIPVLLGDGGSDAVPVVLQPYTRYRLPRQWNDLLRHLTGQPEIVAPPLGPSRALSSRSSSRPEAEEDAPTTWAMVRSDGADAESSGGWTPSSFRVIASHGSLKYDLRGDDPEVEDMPQAFLKVVREMVRNADLSFWEKSDFEFPEKFCSGVLHALLEAWIGVRGDGESRSVPTPKVLRDMLGRIEVCGHLPSEVIQFGDEEDW
jgi:hypothetical protein